MNRKPLFDTIRKILGRGFRQSEVDRLDAAIDAVSAATPLPPAHTYPSSRLLEHDQLIRVQLDTDESTDTFVRGLRLIRDFEGCARIRQDGLVDAYPDPGTGADPWTIGWGATGPGIGPGTVWTQEQCDKRLEEDVARHARDVATALGNAQTTQAQFDALVSFHYNTGAIARSTLLRLHRAGKYGEAAAEFARWNRAGGSILKGLVRRRKAEAALYRSQ